MITVLTGAVFVVVIMLAAFGALVLARYCVLRLRRRRNMRRLKYGPLEGGGRIR